MPKKKPKTGACVYCGRYGPLHYDHIPPKALFPENQQKKGPILVPACKRCNSEASRDDEYFRLVLAMRDDVSGNPVVQSILPSINRSLQNPKKVGFRIALSKAIKYINPTTPSGLILPKREVLTIQMDRVERVISRVTKALFYWHKGYRFPDDHIVVPISPPRLDALPKEIRDEIMRDLIAPLGAQPNRGLGSGVFSYKYIFTTIEPHSTAWLYLFYGRVSFVGLTGPKEGIQP